LAKEGIVAVEAEYLRISAFADGGPGTAKKKDKRENEKEERCRHIADCRAP